jgi:hypothetical protein
MFDEDLNHNAGRRLAFQNLPLRAMEIHSDRKARFTGYFFLEYSCHGKASGISITKAKYWAIELYDDCWAIVSSARLKQLAEQQKELRGNIHGGDDGAAEGVLVPLGALFQEQRKPAMNEKQDDLFNKEQKLNASCK